MTLDSREDAVKSGRRLTHGRQCTRNGVALILCIPGLLHAITAGATVEFQFRVPAGPATRTLEMLAEQANDAPIMLDWSLLSAVLTKEIVGRMDLDTALDLALQGTDVGFKILEKGTITFCSRNKGERECQHRDSPVATTATRAPSQTETPESAARKSEPPKRLEELTVFGSKIRGIEPIGTSSISLSRQDLASSGYVNFDGVIQSMPQVFRAGAGPVVHSSDPVAQSNSGFGESVNLRGFGAQSTLVMVDGNRLAPSGSLGQFIDISNIPVLAVDHVDIITGGTSALYGADAVGGVVNYVTRDGEVATEETTAFVGSVTQGGLHQVMFGHFSGAPWSTGSAAFGVEYFQQTPLETDARGFASSDQSAHGGTNWDTTSANPGTEFVHGHSYAIPTSSNGRPSPTLFSVGGENLEDLYQNYYLIASQERLSSYITARQELGSETTASLTGFYTQREAKQENGGQRLILTVPSTNPFYVNPSGGSGPVQVGYDLASTVGALTTDSNLQVSSLAVTVESHAGQTSTVRFTASTSRELEFQRNYGMVDPRSANIAAAYQDAATALNPFGSGVATNPQTVASISRRSTFESRSVLDNFSLTLDGSVVNLPGGPLKGAIGIEYRAQYFDTDLFDGVSGAGVSSRLTRHVDSGAAELRIPVLPFEESKGAKIGSLDVSIAGHFDVYSDMGSTVAPQARAQWQPIPTLQLWAGIDRSIQQPILSDLQEKNVNTAVVAILPDTASMSGQSRVLLWSGNNRSLSAERALSRTAGFRWNPLDWLVTQLTYFDITFSERIQPTELTGDILNNVRYGNVVSRNPSPTLMQRICGGSLFFGSYAQCLGSNVSAVVDLRLQNGETLFTRGVDFSLQSAKEYGLGIVNVQIQGTYLLDFADEASDRPEVSLLNTPYNPVRLRALASLGFDFGRVGSSITVHQTSGYRNTEVIPIRDVASWTTVDLQLKYRPSRASDSALHGMEFFLTCQNCLDRNPPYTLNPIDQTGFDPGNTTPLNRFISLRGQKRW